MSRARAINLAAGAAALPLEVLERASAEFVETDHSGMSRSFKSGLGSHIIAVAS